MIYFGPARRARQYFLDMGYRPTAERQTTPDFLVSVTDPNGRKMADEKERTDNGIKGPIPRTPQEFEMHYRSSEIYQINKQDIEDYRANCTANQEIATEYRESARAEHSRHTLWKVGSPLCILGIAQLNFSCTSQSPYTISSLMQLRIVMMRRVQILKGNIAPQALTTLYVPSGVKDLPSVWSHTHLYLVMTVPSSWRPSSLGRHSSISRRRHRRTFLVEV